MFANITWRKFVLVLLGCALMTGCAFLVKYGEDGQVGTGNEISTSMFIFAALGVLYDLAILPILLRRK